MRLRITNAIENIAKEKFHEMMKNGAFSSVGFSETVSASGTWLSYNMMEYSFTYARLMKLLDQKIVDTGLDELGAFTRKRSKAFLTDVQTLLDRITETDVKEFKERFHTIWD